VPINAPARSAVLELVAPGLLDEDLRGLEPGLEGRGMSVHGVLAREVVRGSVDLRSADLVAGRLPVVGAALRQLGLAVPAPLDYLDASDDVLGRRVWSSTLAAVAAGLELRGEPVFVKPRGATKRFTGRVVSDPVDLRSLPVRSGSTPVWCSEVVDMTAEHRVFVSRGAVVGVRQYDGAAREPDDVELAARASRIVESLLPQLPAGCAVDVAELGEGTVVLVEVNDGFSLGRYGLDADAYLDVLLTRWAELTAR
jgi:hypothetical protein